jgi:hypothetical protein
MQLKIALAPARYIIEMKGKNKIRREESVVLSS